MIIQIWRAKNKADIIAKSAIENEPIFQNLFLKEEIVKPSTKENEVLTTYEIAEWIKPIAEYLETGKLPDDKNKAKKIWIQAAQYSFQNGNLYRRLFSHL